MTDKKKKTSKTSGDIDGNSSKIDELITAISMMSDDITKIVKAQSCIQDLLKTIQALQKENEMKDIMIKTLENRIDDLEQYSKMDNVIISGLNVQYRTYARTASNLPIDNYSVQEAGTLEENVLAFLNKHNIPIEKSDVSICHPLKSKGSNSVILLKCSNRKAKLDVMKNAKKLKGSNVYINEHLTKRNSDLAYKAIKKIYGTYNIYMDT